MKIHLFFLHQLINLFLIINEPMTFNLNKMRQTKYETPKTPTSEVKLTLVICCTVCHIVSVVIRHCDSD